MKRDLRASQESPGYISDGLGSSPPPPKRSSKFENVLREAYESDPEPSLARGSQVTHKFYQNKCTNQHIPSVVTNRIAIQFAVHLVSSWHLARRRVIRVQAFRRSRAKDVCRHERPLFHVLLMFICGEIYFFALHCGCRASCSAISVIAKEVWRFTNRAEMVVILFFPSEYF